MDSCSLETAAMGLTDMAIFRFHRAELVTDINTHANPSGSIVLLRCRERGGHESTSSSGVRQAVAKTVEEVSRIQGKFEYVYVKAVLTALARTGLGTLIAFRAPEILKKKSPSS